MIDFETSALTDFDSDLDFTAQDATDVLTDIIAAVRAILVETSDTSKNLTGNSSAVAPGENNTDALLIFYESSASDFDAVLI